VDGLNTTNFNANLGTNTQLFGTFSIGGASPPALSFLAFNGAAYNYNPAAGNLLLDVRVSSITAFGSTFFRSRNNAPGGNYSRAFDFGTGFEGFGLDTRFRGGPTQVVPEPSTYVLLATGLGAVGFVARRRKQAA
jgi:hypothetical protein